jgi:glycosyltransferase involved in cell wall biosynthesis
MRVALLTNILTPYRVPVYRELAATPGWELRVLLSAATEFDRRREFAEVAEGAAQGLDVEIVGGGSLRRPVLSRARQASEQGATLHLSIGVPSALRRFGPDVVVSAELGVRTFLAALYARAAGVPLVVWSYRSRASACGAGRLRNAWGRGLLREARAVVGMGTQAREVLAALGVPADRIFDAPNAHDVEGCERALASRDREACRAALRARGGARDRIALFAGRLVASKGVRELLAVWTGIPEALRRDWTLLLLGSGPLEREVQAAAARAPSGTIVHAPAVRASGVYDFYLGSDLLVVPSLAEPWGLVVNEAFACGLPALCSARAGCADDLLRPGENGWLFDPADATGFSRTLSEALSCDALPRLGECGRGHAKRFTPQSMAQGLRGAVHHAMGAAR